jgi:hypothetical protein
MLSAPAPEEVAVAFGLGEARDGLVHVRRGDADAWRLDTASGRYFVKGYFVATAQLIEQLAVAMAFEGRALLAGVDMAEPIAPVDPVLGWVGRVEGRLFRVYRWIEHETSQADRDASAWLGRTMMQVHQLQPLGRVGLPEWWREAVHSPGTWEGWFAKARSPGKLEHLRRLTSS